MLSAVEKECQITKSALYILIQSSSLVWDSESNEILNHLFLFFPSLMLSSFLISRFLLFLKIRRRPQNQSIARTCQWNKCHWIHFEIVDLYPLGDHVLNQNEVYSHPRGCRRDWDVAIDLDLS